MAMPSTHAPRWIELEGAVNARDVAGLPLSAGGAVTAGRLLRSDNLQDLTPGDVDHLVDDRRVRAVIDLRTASEVRLEGPGPLTGDARVVIEHRSLYPEAGEHTDVLEGETVVQGQDGTHGADMPGESHTVQAYFGYMERRPDSIVAALRTIADPPEAGATLVHCAAGKDRTGLVVAFALEAAGVRREAVVGDYAVTTERIEAIIARLIRSPTYAQDIVAGDPLYHAAQPEAMARILELLDERHGSPAGWLRDHGLEDDALDALRARLTA